MRTIQRVTEPSLAGALWAMQPEHQTEELSPKEFLQILSALAPSGRRRRSVTEIGRRERLLAAAGAALKQSDAAIKRRIDAIAPGPEAMRASGDETVCSEVEAELDLIGKLIEEQELLQAEFEERRKRQADEVNRAARAYLARLTRISSPRLRPRARGRSRRPAMRARRSASSRKVQTDSGGSDAGDGDGDGDGDPPGHIGGSRSPAARRSYHA